MGCSLTERSPFSRAGRSTPTVGSPTRPRSGTPRLTGEKEGDAAAPFDLEGSDRQDEEALDRLLRQVLGSRLPSKLTQVIKEGTR